MDEPSCTSAAPKVRAWSRRAGSGSTAATRAPAVVAMATAVRPSIPAPVTSTRRPSSGPAAAIAAATVAVAQDAGLATSSGRSAGTATTAVPGSTTQWVANPPVNGALSTSGSCPYFRRPRHLCGSPRAQRSQLPQDAVTDQTTRVPGVTGDPSTQRTPPAPTPSTVPTCSWPSSAGTGEGRRPDTVWRSLPQTVARSIRTSSSPDPGTTEVRSETTENGLPTPSQRA